MKRAPLIVGASGAAVLVLGSLLHPVVSSVPEPPAVTIEPVETSRMVCPDPFGNPIIDSVVSGIVAPGLAAKGSTGGAAAMSTIAPKGTATVRVAISGVGQARSLATNGGSLPPVVAAGAGALAPGLALDQITLGAAGRTRGLAAMECFAPGTDQWFVGGGSGVGRTTSVTLANPEESPATVDVLLYGDKGALPAPAGRGVFVPARGQVRVLLTTLAPGVSDFVVNIQTRSGRVSASISDRLVNGLIPRGLEWVPQSPAPSTRVVVAGIPGKVSPVRLSVLSPNRDTSVKVRVITPAGGYIPAGLAAIPLVAGQVKTVDVTKILREQPAAIELISSAPITAGAWYRLGSETGIAEFAYAASAPSLTSAAVVAGLPVASGYRHRLYLTNPDGERDTTVVVTLIDRSKKSTRVKLKIPKGTTQVWTARAPGNGIFSIIVTPAPGGPRVYGARVSSLPASDGTMATGVPLSPVRSRVSIPQAQPDLSVAIG